MSQRHKYAYTTIQEEHNTKLQLVRKNNTETEKLSAL